MYELIRRIYHIFKYLVYSVINLKYDREIKKMRILDDKQTVDKIVYQNKSISRFGDGEFRWILNSTDIPPFQDNSEELGNRLLEVLKSKDERVLICIPRILKYNKGFKFETKLFWKNIVKTYFYKLLPEFYQDIEYGNASVSRFYIDYRKYEGATERINNLKRIWQQKKILLVEGEETKFGVNNDLLDNANEVRRIICPSRNAYCKYQTILNSIKNNYQKGEIVLISLGPTATILSYDLALDGIQAIDIGHLDAEYEWYKMKAKKRFQINGKNNTEVNKNGAYINNINLDQYNEEIIERIE